ncbi:uncharacterized protein LOC135121661 [Zophobas morio]|uniref:uncharacterized protein LOC135121661 n=1 Tax=Zophobas morio TaxID=2755281 RepID=UPI003083E89E
MEDEISCMIFAIQFVPRSGNKYFIAACDHSLKIFDLESRKEIAKFDDLYSCYCDDVLPVVCPSFINFPQEESRLCTCYLLTRGVEDVNEDGLAIEANKVILHKLLPPEEPNGDWALLTERIFEDEHYYANSYLCRLATNGLYVAAPTVTGSVFIWNLLSGLKTAVIKEPNAAEREVRDILFHPSRNLLFITGDDGIIRVYKSESL